ncbi:MAG: elongation factor P [Nitrospirae bacterium]|nr:elongation factor P [Nitrospirota bacterium]MBI5694696.1 elongation factor P [Nitrospirota bacterium]
MLSTSEFRNGAKMELDGEPYIIIEFQHVKPGKGGAFVRTKIKSLRTGNVIDRTFRSGEKVETPNLEEKSMQFLYATGDEYMFMDNETYEQSGLTAAQLGDNKNWLKEEMVIQALYHNGTLIGVEVPMFVELKIVQTDPGVKGDTASGGTKPATLETGAVVKVPLYMEEGEVLKIDTRTGEYLERVK